jgi:dienelactone hydrolase
MYRLFLCWLGLGLFFGIVLSTHAQDKACAMVVMHGKWGNPQSISHFGRKLESVCAYKSIEMPWSRRRSYDQPYPVALAEIAEEVKSFRAQGYKRVVLAGHSFGANAAIAYMAEVGDVDGIIALAPGHAPELMYKRGFGKDAVDKARSLVESGQGTEMLEMDDRNQGKQQTMRMSAAVLLSYFDPQGLGHMPASVSRFKKPVPFLWVIGTRDPLYPAGESFAYSKAPFHSASKYLVVDADHSGTPDAAAEQALEWVKSLP